MNNKIFVGPPGSGKTYRAKYEVVKIIWELLDDAKKRCADNRYYNPVNFCEKAFNYVESAYSPLIKLTSLHEGMTSADFIEGIEISTKGDSAVFKNVDKVVLQLLTDMKETGKPGFLILDDIHRVSLAGVLGELLFAFSHRNEKITLSTGKIVCVPDNLYVFLTMNTLRPEFPIETSVFGSFQIIYMQTGKAALETAIVECYYREAYYGISAEIIDELIHSQQELHKLISEIKDTGFHYKQIFDIENLFLENMGVRFDEAMASKLMSMNFPVTWSPRNDIPNKYMKKYNQSAEKFTALMNEAYERYSKYISAKTQSMLIDFKAKAGKEYDYYNGFLDYIAPEYYDDKERYSIGYTYFLPGRGFSMWNADRLLQNKIRAQVLPLLIQYKNEGIIIGCKLPGEEHTTTEYTRNYKDVSDEKIEISLNISYRNIFLQSFNSRQSADFFKEKGGISYNANYGVLFELLNDMIQAPLINYWEIMDVLLYDKEIYFKLDESRAWGSCLLCDSELAARVRLGTSDASAGNNNGVYRPDLHAFFYRGRKYYMVSKIKTESRERYQNIKKCRQNKSVKRELSLYGMVKVLVYDYLEKYVRNLKGMKNEQADPGVAAQIESEIAAVLIDMEKIDQLELRGANNDELRWNLLSDIRALPTWANMKSKTLRGVYKIMDDRFQTVMDSTGIHQMILQGPPGTSKTYGVKEFLAIQSNLIKSRGEKWNEDDLNARQLITKNGEYIIPTENLSENNMLYWDIIQFHPSYTYEDFVRGISVSASDGNYAEIGGEILENGTVKYAMRLNQPMPIIYRTVNRTLGKMAKIARENYNEKNPENSPRFYLVIDEINRANLATVFGELIYALEYRDSKVATPYAIGEDTRLQIPNNLYIIGTMNTADKSISSIDYAIRRRFLFFPVLPDIRVVYENVKENWKSSMELKLFFMVERIFDFYMNTDDYNRSDVQIGHTYFIRKDGAADAEKMKNRFLYQVIPVLREYYNDGILMEDFYSSAEPSDIEKECMDIIKNMTEMSDVDVLEAAYQVLTEKISSDEIVNSIEKKLESRNVLTGENEDIDGAEN